MILAIFLVIIKTQGKDFGLVQNARFVSYRKVITQNQDKILFPFPP